MMNIATREASKKPESRQRVDKEIILNSFQDWDLQGSHGIVDGCKSDVKDELRKDLTLPVSHEERVLHSERKEERLSPSSNKERNPKRSDIRSKRPTQIASQGSRSDEGRDQGRSKPTSPVNSAERRSRSSYSKRPSERRLSSSLDILGNNPLQHMDKDGKSKSALTSRRPSQHGARLRRASSERNLFPSPHNSPQRRSGTEKASPSRRQMIHRLGTASGHGHGPSSDLRFSLSKKSLSARSLYEADTATDRSMVPLQCETERKGAEGRNSNVERAPSMLTRSCSTRSVVRRNTMSAAPFQKHDSPAEGPFHSIELDPHRVERKQTNGVDVKAPASSRRPSKSSVSSSAKPVRPTSTDNACHATSRKENDNARLSNRQLVRRESSRRLVSKFKETDPLSSNAAGLQLTADSTSPNAAPLTACPNGPTSVAEPVTKPTSRTATVSETRRRLHSVHTSSRRLSKGTPPEPASGSAASGAAATTTPDPPQFRRRYSTGSSHHDPPFSFGGLRPARSREAASGAADDSPRSAERKSEQPQRPARPPHAGAGQLKSSLHQLCASTFGGVSLHRNQKHSDLVSVASEMTDLNGAPPSASGGSVAPYCASSIQIDLSDPTNIDFYFFKTSHQGCGGAAAALAHRDDDTTTVTTTKSFG